MHVVGDMTSLDKLPGVAQVAIQGAKYSANAIKRRIAGKSPQEPFKYFDKGSMATISRFSAVADLGGKMKFSGFIAWVIWLVVHLFYIVGFKSRITTVPHWAVSFLAVAMSQRVATQQQIFGRLRGRARSTVRGVEDRGPKDIPMNEDVTSRESA